MAVKEPKELVKNFVSGALVPGAVYRNSQVAAQHQAAFEYALVA